jgi:hypothetical protein
MLRLNCHQDRLPALTSLREVLRSLLKPLAVLYWVNG